MPRFRVAHLREQGVDLIIIPLEPSFGQKGKQEQRKIINELQSGANSAGLAGTVVPVWNDGNSMSFSAHPNLHQYFQSITWDYVMVNLNKEIFW